MSTRPVLARLGTVLFDIAMVCVAYAFALWLRFDGDVPNVSWNYLIWAGPLIGLAYVLAYYVVGVYRTAWQYATARDAVFMVAAIGVVTAGVLGVNALLPTRPLPLTVNVIGAAFVLLLHITGRLAPRMLSQAIVSSSPGAVQKRVMIVGAGDTGQQLAWELQHNRSQSYRGVCFVDDDPSLKGKHVHRLPVVGGRFAIPEAIKKYDIELVAIALASANTSELQEIFAMCEAAQVAVRLVPSLAEVVAGKAQRGELRALTMEDLLARAPMDVDEDACRAAITGRVVMITGAAGSIGIELTRRIAGFNPAALHLVDTGETGLFELRGEIVRDKLLEGPVKAWLCSISDRQKLTDVFEASRPQVVFHLAAYKHIGMMEEHPDQAFETNVLGTLNVFEAAQSVQAENVVFMSSHTAVNPASVYGATKRVGELLVTSMQPGTRFCAVRLTNVIDTRGAVLALFTRQLQGGGPVTVTDPEVARYFLSVSEVVGLVIQSAALSKGGELFTLDVGEELRIGELAERLIRTPGHGAG